MAISTQISRLTTLRNNIRTKLIDIGILSATSTSATLSECYNVLSTVTGLAATSYTPTTTAQTISSGYYLKGAQTINAIPSSYIIPTGTSAITSNGTYDVKAYASASVSVPYTGRILTISGTGGGVCFVQLNGVTCTNGVVNFNEGDVLTIYSGGQHGGGYIYINGEQEAFDPYDQFSYDLTLPKEDIDVILSYGATGRVDVNYRHLIWKTITQNGEYNAWFDDNANGYEGVQVNVPIPSGYLIPTGTISLSSNGTYDVGSYASASINVQGGPSRPYVYMSSIFSNKSNAMFGSLNGIYNDDLTGFMACMSVGGFDAFELLSNFSPRMFQQCTMYFHSQYGGFSKYYNSNSDSFDISFPNITSISRNGDDAFRNANLFFISSNSSQNKVVNFIFPNLSIMSTGTTIFRTFGFGSGTDYGGSCKLSFPILTLISGFNQVFAGQKMISSDYGSVSYLISGETGAIVLDRQLLPLSVAKNRCPFHEIYAPMLSEIRNANEAFAFCQGMSSINLPTLSVISGARTFIGCNNLTSVSLPLLESLQGENQFAGCENLSNLYLPKLKNISASITGNIYTIGSRQYSISSTLYSNGSYKSALYIQTACGVEVASFPEASGLSAYAFYKNINLKEVYLNNIDTLTDARYTFQYCPNLSLVYFPKLSFIKNAYNTFTYCINLTSIDFPLVTSISTATYMFDNCQKLNTISFPKLLSMNSAEYFCVRCYSLETFYAPSLSYIYSARNMFESCTYLKNVDFPSLLYISNANSMFFKCDNLSFCSFGSLQSISTASGTFYQCFSLKNINMNNLLYIGTAYSMFGSCSCLESIRFEKMLSISGSTNYMFAGCSSMSLAIFDMMYSASLSTYMFSSCMNFISIFLLGSSVCTLTTNNAFYSTPISNYTTSAWRFGSVYVPSSLLTSYKTATNWTTISSKIFAYESFFGTIGSFGYIDSSWTPGYSSTFNAQSASRNGYYYKTNNAFFNTLNSHYTVVYDDVVYPLATYSSNANLFGAPLSGTSHNWTYYPFYFDNTGNINTKTSGTHTIKIYDQLP